MPTATRPASLAWLAKQRGFAAVGIVDFDVLDAVDEFLDACELAGVRGSAGIETRVFIPEFATREINSPGEPGVYYHMGIGFTSGQAAGEAAATLGRHARAAPTQRNRDMIGARQRAPGAGRHRLRARRAAADARRQRHRAPHAGRLHPRGRRRRRCRSPAATFWAEKLGATRGADRRRSSATTPKFSEPGARQADEEGRRGLRAAQRRHLPHGGGVPPLHRSACGALPCATWLDGTSAGEQAIDELLDLLIGKGAVALNIIPDRNWNIADPEHARAQGAQAVRDRATRSRLRPAAQRRHRDERSGQQARGRFRRAGAGAGRRRFSTAPTSSTATR